MRPPMARPPSRPRRPVRSAAPIVRKRTLRLSPDVARRVRAGHPWVYREALDPRRPVKEEPGETIELIDPEGDFVARGFFDGETAISVRVLTRNPDREIDDKLIEDRLRSAVALRRKLIDFDAYEAIRLVNGENDGLPGISVDRYRDYMVVQLFSSAVLRYLPALYRALEDTVEVQGRAGSRRRSSSRSARVRSSSGSM
jgi:23S rRNA (cytosine1962-C5)-methyltransferase